MRVPLPCPENADDAVYVSVTLTGADVGFVSVRSVVKCGGPGTSRRIGTRPSVAFEARKLPSEVPPPALPPSFTTP